MRVLLACCLVACTAPAPLSASAKPAGPAAPAAAVTARTGQHAAVDVIVALAADPHDVASLVPGPAQLALGGTSIQAVDGAQELEVEVFEEQGNDVRVGVRLANARFAIWTARARLLAVLSRDERIAGEFGVGTDAIEVVLLAGAQVRRIAHEGSRTKIRYVGALEVEGWVADESVADRSASTHSRSGKIPTGRRTLMVTPGTVIRTEPRWIGAQLAVMNQSYFVDTVNTLDDGWYEVAYEDSDVRVHGFASTHDPPGRTHQRRPPEPQPPPYVPNATIADRTCLYSDGNPIGFVVGSQPALVEPGSHQGWMTITLDTPAWGTISFEARGINESSLETCGT
jgi:hypothetical protein